MKPQDVKFFKISHAGFDKARREFGTQFYKLYHLLITLTTDAWANEDLIKAGTADTFQLPSDIKPGLYILRTELLALHGNRMSATPTAYSGPQFYTHCFNVDITGNGNAVPEGVTFPGSYKRDDPGVKFNLYRSQADWDNYVSFVCSTYYYAASLTWQQGYSRSSSLSRKVRKSSGSEA
jgi:hypothetical protein